VPADKIKAVSIIKVIAVFLIVFTPTISSNRFQTLCRKNRPVVFIPFPFSLKAMNPSYP